MMDMTASCVSGCWRVLLAVYLFAVATIKSGTRIGAICGRFQLNNEGWAWPIDGFVFNPQISEKGASCNRLALRKLDPIRVQFRASVTEKQPFGI